MPSGNESPPWLECTKLRLSRSTAIVIARVYRADRLTPKSKMLAHSIAYCLLSGEQHWSGRERNLRRVHTIEWALKTNHAAYRFAYAVRRNLVAGLAIYRTAAASGTGKSSWRHHRTGTDRGPVRPTRCDIGARFCCFRDFNDWRHGNWFADGPIENCRSARRSLAHCIAQSAGTRNHRPCLYLGRTYRDRCCAGGRNQQIAEH